LHTTAKDQRIFLVDRSTHALSDLDLWAAFEATGAVLPPLAGLVLTIKACFDTAGWITSSASASTLEDAPASRDSITVAALREAGAVVLGQTNMTEFAYGALGVNNHFGTPRTPLDATGERVAGGSTSGGAVAAATGLADVSLGSDTSGSVRIPAAFCGCFGFKPSLKRYRREGMAFLAPSFDVPGLLSSDLGMIARADQVLAQADEPLGTPIDPRALRYAIPAHLADIDIAAPVRAAFETAIAALTARGVRIETVNLPALAESATITAVGGMIGAEAYELHRDRLSARFDLYDPLVRKRICKGQEVAAYRYIAAARELAACKVRFDGQIAGFAGFLLPTTPILAPKLADLSDLSSYLAINLRAFELTEYANRLDLPSVTVPFGQLPTGLMLTGVRGGDVVLLAQAHLLAEVTGGLEFTFSNLQKDKLMIVITADSLTGTARHASGPGWESRRLIVRDDGVDISVHETRVSEGAELHLHYKNHFETNYCFAGEGEVVNKVTGEIFQIRPGTLYALDKNDPHILRATKGDLRLVCTFTPPLKGTETHRDDGSYAVD
jgi:amidase/aspartyl-tRNA(Asn)/glutamyl-tRNA(Gln) amidotransferase subunit A